MRDLSPVGYAAGPMAGALDKLPAGSNGSPAPQQEPLMPPVPHHLGGGIGGGGIRGYPGLEPGQVQLPPPAPVHMPMGARPAAPQAHVPSPQERPAHLCMHCKHYFEVHVMLLEQDDSTPYINPVTGEPMKERQGSCQMKVSDDLTNETIMGCTHFENRRGIVGRIAELVRKVIG